MKNTIARDGPYVVSEKNDYYIVCIKLGENRWSQKGAFDVLEDALEFMDDLANPLPVEDDENEDVYLSDGVYVSFETADALGIDY